MPLRRRRPGTSTEINYKLKALFLLSLRENTGCGIVVIFIPWATKNVEAINVIWQLKAIACEHSWMDIINCCVTRMPLTTERFPVWLSKVGEMKGMLPHTKHRINSFQGNTKPISIYFHKTYNEAIRFLIWFNLIKIILPKRQRSARSLK